MYQITKTDIEAVKKYGAEVFCITERFAIPMPELTQPYNFINPKDAGNGFGEEHLRGDGSDVLLLNGVTNSQGVTIKDYLQNHPLKNAAEIHNFLVFLSDIGTNDVYASDCDYLQKEFEIKENKISVGFYARRRDIIYRAARLKASCVLIKRNDFSQYAANGALLIVPENIEETRLTNVPADYQSLSGNIPDLETLKPRS